MALVSGRPISFQMDLSPPLYVSRPVVVPELFQSLRPVAYSGSMDGEGRRVASGFVQGVQLSSNGDYNKVPEIEGAGGVRAKAEAKPSAAYRRQTEQSLRE